MGFRIGQIYRSVSAGYFMCPLNQLSRHHLEVCVWSTFTHNWCSAVGVMCSSDSENFPCSLLVTGGERDLIFHSDAILSTQARALFESTVNHYAQLKQEGHV